MKVLAFDLGNVIFDFNYDIGLEKIKGKIGVSTDEVIKELFCNDFSLDLEKGLISEYNFYLKFCKRFCISLSYKEFIDAWCRIFFPKPEVIDLVKRLKSKYPVYLISNICKPHFDYLSREYPEVLSLFNDLILSFKVKSVKPQKRIFQALKEAAGVEFNNIIYIDDRPGLIDAAKSLGFQCIQFANCAQLIHDLKSLGISIP